MKKYTPLTPLLAAGLVLGAFSPLHTRAQNQNTWLDTTGNQLWDLASANWSGPAIWNQGDNAVFNATGKRVRDLPITLDKLM